MEKWLSKNWSSLAGETRWNLACDIRFVLHIMLPESQSFNFFLTVCHILPEGLSTVEANQVLTSAQDAIVRDGDGINNSLRLP